MCVFAAFVPQLADASIFSVFTPVAQADTAGVDQLSNFNSQQMPLSASSVGPATLLGGRPTPSASIQDAALLPVTGPLQGTPLAVPAAATSTAFPSSLVHQAVLSASAKEDGEASDDASITVHPIKDTSKRDLGNAILRPVALASSIETQGAHGYNGDAVDLAAPAGTPIVASLDGTVLLAQTGGYNDGYGDYVIIMSEVGGHEVETLYAHMSKVIAVAATTVTRGETIGFVGMTGDATGDHVHFEVRGAQNPLALDPNYTGE